MLKIGTLIATLIAASTFVTEANAHGMGSFYASPFFRNQGRQSHESHCDREKRLRFEAMQQAQERMAAIQSRRAALAAAAAKRARIAELQRQQAAAIKKVAAKKAVAPASTNAVAKKGDELPVVVASAPQSNTGAKTASVETTEVCRKYSAAADGLIEVPCP